MQHAGQILSQQITERCEAAFTKSAGADLRIQLALDPEIGAEGYRVDELSRGGVRIRGGDQRGLIYGLGKFLRTSRYDGGGFTPRAWRGTAKPASPVRGIYFATHFGNFYEEAPIEEVRRYLDELVLWGINHVQVTFPRCAAGETSGSCNSCSDALLAPRVARASHGLGAQTAPKSAA